jgi:pre-mRNA-splicing factor ATP-dependent RNA helicase DHX16
VSAFHYTAKQQDEPVGEGTVITKSSTGSSRKESRKERDSKSDKREKESKTDRMDKESKADRPEKESKSKRRRRRHSNSDSEDEVVIDEEALWQQREKRREEIRRKKKKSSDEEDTKMSNLTEEERADIEREKDKRERDEFAKRLIEKDKKKQRQLDDSESDDSRGKQEKEARRMERLKKREDKDRRLARGEAVVLDSDDEGGNSKKKAISISDMRAESRRAYLQKRTKRELELLERELQDEEEIIAKLGGSSKMTAEEQRELQLKRDILRMAREHGHVDTDEAEAAKRPDGFYRLPEDYDEGDESGKKKSRAQKGEELLTSRYVEPKQEKSEQQLWEEGQTQMAAGLSRHKKKKKRSGDEEDDEDKYDFVFEEEQIDFVCVDTNKGYDNRKKRPPKKDESSVREMEEDEKALEMRPATKHEKILEGRKKLPVYPYR